MNEESALVPENYSDLPREAKKTADSTFDRIYKYYHNSKTRIELSPDEIKIRDRWENAWRLLCRHRTRKQVVELIERLHHVSRSVAYDDVRNACMLFSDPKNDLKDSKRSIAEEALLQGAKVAWKRGNLEMHLKYWKEYTELNQLKEDPAQDMSQILAKLKPNQIIIVASPEELRADAKRLQDELINDIEHIEINEGKDSED